MSRRILVLISICTAFMITGRLEAQQANSSGPGGCEACRQYWFYEAQTWAHHFGEPGYIEDTACNSGPDWDGLGCHSQYVNGLCTQRHEICYPVDGYAEELAKAVIAGDATAIEKVLARSEKITRRADGSGFDLKSCDDTYTIVVAAKGDISVVLTPKEVITTTTAAPSARIAQHLHRL